MRFALAAALPCLLGASLLALATGAAGAEKSKAIPSPSLFPYLDTYLNLPANTRDRYHLSYVVGTQGGQKSDFHMTLNRPSGDVALSIAPDGEILPLPTLADLKDKTPVTIQAPDGSRFGMSLRVAATIEMAKTYDATPLKASIEQARSGAKKAAGLLAVAVPDFQTVCFAGTLSGTATLANGKTVALPGIKQAGDVPAGTPCFTPSALPDARTIALDRAPRVIYIQPKPKS
ncbi:hypothetical protein [Asticcacaulis solisilvae]|uniref:hypothetical protein n=1 Tax=Asticcacaulis solisilvae TaxID=1217274 RepID=UPI003FD7E22F